LIVFAQGASVTINGIKTPSGNIVKSTTNVGVKYTEQPATNKTTGKVATNLVGGIATFNADFAAGDYSLDISGAETIEIYYKPNVEIAAYLTDSNGKEVTDMDRLEAGEYTIDFGFVKKGTSEKVPQSKLLGNVDYAAEVTNNDVKHEKVYKPSEKITIEEGAIKIDVQAKFLEYNSVTSSLEYTIYKNKKLEFTIQDNPTYNINVEGFENDTTPIILRATVDGREISAEEWSTIGLPKVAFKGDDVRYGDFKVEKSDTPGEFKVFPSISGKPEGTAYENTEYQASLEEAKDDGGLLKGSVSGTLQVKDNRSWFEKNKDAIKKGLLFLLIALLILGYVPPFKKYLPKKLSSQPSITIKPKAAGMTKGYAYGRYDKDNLSAIIPYKAVTGTIRFVPAGTGVGSLKVKASKRGLMLVANAKNFAGKKHIQFNGSPISEGKRTEITAGCILVVDTATAKYSCTLNA
jgi:hypothetical protein